MGRSTLPVKKSGRLARFLHECGAFRLSNIFASYFGIMIMQLMTLLVCPSIISH